MVNEINKQWTSAVKTRGEFFDSCEYPFAKPPPSPLVTNDTEPFPTFDPYILEEIDGRWAGSGTTSKGEPGEYLYGHSFAVKELAGPEPFPTPFDYEFVYPEVDIEFKPTYESHIAPRAPPARLSKSLPSSPSVHLSKFESFPAFDSHPKPRSEPQFDGSSESTTVNQSPLAGEDKSGAISKQSQVIVTQLKLENMQYSGAQYSNPWGNETTYRAYINGKEVTGADEKDSKPPPKAKKQQPKGSSSEGNSSQPREQSKNTLAKFVSAFSRKHPPIEGLPPKHDPHIVYGEASGPHPGHDFSHTVPKPQKLDIRMANGDFPSPRLHRELDKLSPQLTAIRSFSLKEVKRTLSQRMLRPKKVEQPPIYKTRMVGLSEQEIPVPDRAAQLTQERVNSISKWVNMIPSDEKRLSENFAALTTSELLHIGGANLDRVELVKRYYGPTNTPDNEGIYAEELDDISRELETQPRHKDLIEYLGTRNSGFHLFSMMDTEKTYEDPINLSDYYGLPLVEPDKSFRMAEESRNVFSDDTSSVYSDLDQPHTISHPPRRHLPPSQSLILYLHGKGLSVPIITALLNSLSQDWLFYHDSPSTADRVYKGLFVPELPSFSDELVNRILKLYKREPLRWELGDARDELGMIYSVEWKQMKRRVKEREIRTLVVKVVENHIWWRLGGGEVRHTDVLGGRV